MGDREHDLAPLIGSLGFLVRAIHIQLGDRLREKGGLGMSPASLVSLMLIDHNPGIRQIDAARLLLIQKSNFAALVKDLTEKGWIDRRSTERDKRGGLWITEAGLESIRRARQADAVQDEFITAVPGDEYQAMMATLRKLYFAGLPQ